MCEPTAGVTGPFESGKTSATANGCASGGARTAQRGTKAHRRRTREESCKQVAGAHENDGLVFAPSFSRTERRQGTPQATGAAFFPSQLKQSSTCQVVVFRVKSLLNKRHLFKVGTSSAGKRPPPSSSALHDMVVFEEERDWGPFRTSALLRLTYGRQWLSSVLGGHKREAVPRDRSLRHCAAAAVECRCV